MNTKTTRVHRLQAPAVCLAMFVVCGMSAGMSSSELKGMANPELVELLGDQKWGDSAFGEIIERLERNRYDDNGDLAKVLFDRWQNSTNERVRSWCFQGLRLLKSQAAADVLTTQLLNGKSRHERCIAARALGDLGQTNAIPTLESVVRTDRGSLGEGPSVGRAAVFSLGAMGRAGAPALMGIWNDVILRRLHREAILSALGGTKDRRFVPILLGVLAGVDEQSSRDNAAWALGEIGDESALPELSRHKDDIDKNVKENTLKAIDKIQERLKERAGRGAEQPNNVPYCQP